MKKEIDTLDATPSKRIFHSIIADYDLNRSICELVDNGIDVWVREGKKKNIAVKIFLNKEQQTITVEDNAGGLKKSELSFIVGPGQTGSNLIDETIGIFGVGTKRAVVALAQDIKIKTRYPREKGHQVEFDDSWLGNESWELPVFEIDGIGEGATIIELVRLRLQITDEIISQLRDYLSTTYAKFLKQGGVVIHLNDHKILPKFFENWAYPPTYSPRRYTGTLKAKDGRLIKVEAVAGLTRESSPAAGEYGVYFYCNNRLIARALKTFDVGFTKGFAGLPHPKVSLTRVLISLSGDPTSMPWNSSKSDVSTKHEVFLALHAWLLEVVKGYATLSRIWMGDWQDKVFKYDVGKIQEVKVEDFPEANKSFLPPPPKSRPRYGEVITQKNRIISKKKPWTKGLYEGIIAADLILKQKLEQKNRIALIVLDSTLEIAFKEYLVNDSGAVYNDAKLLSLFNNRTQVHAEIKKYISIKDDVWKKVEHFYRLRCKLIHEKASAGLSEQQIQDFRELVERILNKLYKLKFGED